MARDKLIALAVFLAGVALVVVYYFSTLPGPVEEAAPVPGQPVMEITVAGEANGVVRVQLLPEVAPEHVDRIVRLVREGAYDGVVFHRVIEGFMAQTGDVEFGRAGADLARAGTGGSPYPDLPAEFSDMPFSTGTVGMARSRSPNSANSQFFIMFAPAPHLDGQYTVVGRVIDGFEVVEAIKKGNGPNGAVIGAPDVMEKVIITE